MTSTAPSARLVLLALAFLAGCATPTFRSDYDENFGFGEVRTFDWIDGVAGATGGTPFTPLDNARFRQKLELQFARQGLVPARGAEPDVWLRLSIDGTALERPAVALPVASSAATQGQGFPGYRGGFGYRRGYGSGEHYGYRWGLGHRSYGYGRGHGSGYSSCREPASFLALEMFSSDGRDPVWTGWTKIWPRYWQLGDPFSREADIEDLVRGLLSRYPAGGSV